MNKKAIVIGMLATTLAASPVWADRYDNGRGNRHNDFAKVVDVTPIVQQIEVSTPRRECWDEEVVRRDERRGSYSAVPAIVGGIIGGAIGHQIGRGHGRDIATVAGTLIGASVADDAARADAAAVATTPTTRSAAGSAGNTSPRNAPSATT